VRRPSALLTLYVTALGLPKASGEEALISITEPATIAPLFQGGKGRTGTADTPWPEENPWLHGP
jgi:hypothetical protein